MDMTERSIFQPRFSLKLWVGEKVSVSSKKIIPMSSAKHYEDFAKTS
jgi:hypothetical protein